MSVVATMGVVIGAGVGWADPPMPTIPNQTFNVTSYGAVGNDSSADTSAIQAAINAASKAGGGTVLLSGGTFLAGPLTLASNINFEIASGTTLEMLPMSSYPSGNTNFITASHISNFEITGGGAIDGQGGAWWNAYNSNSSISRPRLVEISGCNTVDIQGITLQNAPTFNIAFGSTNNVNISGVTINNPSNSPNTDGIDPAGSNYLIQNCNISTGDDNIAVKPGGSYCSNITITNCTFGAGHGVSIGGQTNDGLNNMTVTNCTFSGTTNGLRLKAGTGEGGVVQNVLFSNITMKNVATPIIINSWYNGGDHYGSKEVSGGSLHTLTNPGDPQVTVDQENNSKTAYPFWDNITYKNITATGATQNVAILYGLDSVPANPADPARNIDSVSFSNVSLSGAYGADIYYVSNLDISGLTVNAKNGSDFNIAGTTFADPAPEPASVGVMSAAGIMLLRRRRGKPKV